MPPLTKGIVSAALVFFEVEIFPAVIGYILFGEAFSRRDEVCNYSATNEKS
jgi:hypothetical protein